MCYSVVSLLTQSTEVPTSVPQGQEQIPTTAVDSYNYSSAVPYSPTTTSSGYSSYSASPNGSPEHSPSYDPLLDIDLSLTPSPEDPFAMVQTDMGYSESPFVNTSEYCSRAYMDGCNDPMYSTVMSEPNPCFPQFSSGVENGKSFGMVRGPNFFFANYPRGIEVAQMFKQCKICGDVASGNHFGVQSCEACKSFFRRSVRSSSRYSCRGSRSCTIEKHTRNRCQYCRLQKCLSNGMRKEAVQEERNPFSGKPTMASLDQMTVTDKQMYASRPTLKVEQLDCSPDSTVSDAVLLNADNGSDESSMATSPTTKPDNCPGNLKNALLKVIEWAKRIPAFVSLSREDQVTLLNSCWHQVFMLLLASQDGSKTLDTEVAALLNSLGADKVERACLKGLLLFNQDAKGLSLASKKRVEVFQDQILQSLETRTRTIYGTSPQRFSKLLMKLGSLKAISLEVVKGMNAPGSAKMSTLFGELL